MTVEQFEKVLNNLKELYERTAALEKAGFTNASYTHPIFNTFEILLSDIFYEGIIDELFVFLSIGKITFNVSLEISVTSTTAQELLDAILLKKSNIEKGMLNTETLNDIIGEYKHELSDDL